MAKAALEQALDKIAADNNLTSISVGRMPVGGATFWTATVHWDGFARSGNACASDHTETSLLDALANAIAAANSDRLPRDAIVDVLPSLEQAA